MYCIALDIALVCINALKNNVLHYMQ